MDRGKKTRRKKAIEKKNLNKYKNVGNFYLDRLLQDICITKMNCNKKYIRTYYVRFHYYIKQSDKHLIISL